MEAEARYTYVGAAVLALLLALVASVLWLRNVGSRSDFTPYAIYFEQQALDGLQVGADVNLRGIKIGRVTDYHLSDVTLNRVRVEVRIDRRIPVHTNTVAVVTRNFVTGIAAIALVNRGTTGAPLANPPGGDELPVIAEGRSNFDEITGRVNEITGRVNQVGELAAAALTSLNLLLANDNRREVMDTVRSLRQLANGMNQRLASLDQALDRTGAAATTVAAAATRLGSAGERIAGVTEQTGQQLATSLAQADLTMIEARTALGRVVGSATRLEQQAGSTALRLEHTAAQIDDQLMTATAELRLSMEAGTRVFDKLRDPRAALLGPGARQVGPGEVRP